MTTVTVTASPRPLVEVPPSDRPQLSCLVVAYGTGKVLIDCLTSLGASLDGSDVGYEVVLVDNLHPVATERTWRLVRTATSGVRVVRPRTNLGFAGANNLAAATARGSQLAMINPDVVLTAGWYEPLSAALDIATIAAPVLLDPDGGVQSAGHTIHDEGSTRPITVAPQAGDTSRPLYASAACWLMRAAEFRRLGGFDEGYWPAYYEDADLALRANADGLGTVVVGASRVVHLHGGSTPASAPADLTVQNRRFCERWSDVVRRQPPVPGCERVS